MTYIQDDYVRPESALWGRFRRGRGRAIGETSVGHRCNYSFSRWPLDVTGSGTEGGAQRARPCLYSVFEGAGLHYSAPHISRLPRR